MAPTHTDHDQPHAHPEDKHFAAAPKYVPHAQRFVGKAVKRVEDPRLLTGHGRYVDDVQPAGCLHAAFVRSNYARAKITKIDASAALALQGVVAVFTHEDLAKVVRGNLRPTMMLTVDGSPTHIIAPGDVRFVGDPVAIVVAESRYIAEDACELVEVDYEPLTPVVDLVKAAADTENIVHPELGSNVFGVLDVPFDLVKPVFDGAAHVVETTLYQHRQTNVPMETRGVMAKWDPWTPEMHIWASTQASHEVKAIASRLLGIDEQYVRCEMRDTGGGFGQKMFMPRDEQAIIATAYLLPGRPVKWIEDRRENLMASNHARTDHITVKMAIDGDGKILGMYCDHLEDSGAYPSGGTGGGNGLVGALLHGPYKLQALAFKTAGVWTNTCGRGAYRGPWMLETVAREEAMDIAARQIGLDPLEFRRRNVVKWEDLPYATPMGMNYDIVTPNECLEQAAAMLDYEAFRAEQQRALAEGRLLGVGIGLYVEPSGMPFGPLATEAVTIRMAPSGKVNVYTGSSSHGQSIETTIIQVVADHLGVDMADISLHQGDTSNTPFGPGTGGSRTAIITGGAARDASLGLKQKIFEVAAHLLEASPDDLELDNGMVSVKGTPSKAKHLMEVCAAAYLNPAGGLPPEMEAGLEYTSRYTAQQQTWSNACHIVTVEVDQETGQVHILRYIVSEDCGKMINPMVVEGQIAGGVVQGIGGVLLEHVVYDDEGNPLTTTFMDYLVPTAGEVPTLEIGHIETPSNTPGGFKGMGEGGAIGAPPAVFNAVADALAQVGVSITRQPCGPNEIIEALAAAGK